MEQRSPEWYAARLGKVTASRVADLMAKTKTGYSTSRANYMAELICERLTGVASEGYTNAAMQWGTDTEPQARAAYEFQTGNPVAEVGFVVHDKIRDLGASPDGLVGDSGLVELKCPNTATHLEFLLTKAIPSKYLTQMQVQMACTNRDWCDFVSFDPRLPANMQLFISRVMRGEQSILEIETEVEAFLAEMAVKLARLDAEYAEAA